MLKNYLKIAFRNLVRHKGYSFINISGLALGMACFILIMLYVQFELSYDNYHTEADRIFRVSRQWLNQDGVSSLHLGHVAPPIAPLLKQDYPEIEQAVRITDGGSPIIKHSDLAFQEDRFYFADPEVFEVFTLPFVNGEAENALAQPNFVVLSEAMAQKYFGDENPVGQVITFVLPGVVQQDFKITGVMQDMPLNSHFHADFLGSMKAVEAAFGPDEFENWGSNNYATYLLLSPNSSPAQVEAHFPEFIDNYLTPQIVKWTGEAPTEAPHLRNKLHLWPLRDIHLHSQLDSELEANGNIIYIYIFGSVAFFVLLIACINFMNLTTARSARRMKEVGLRKVVGADRKRLIFQFLGESLFMSVVSLVLAVLLVEAVLPWFRDFVGQQIAFNYKENVVAILGLLSVALFVGLAAGSYPAFFLSGFEPARALKSASKAGSSKSMLRRVLVIMQFAISIILIISIGVVYNQLSYCNNLDLGLNKEHIVVLPVSQNMRDNFPDIKNRLLQHPLIANVAGSKRVPSGRLLDSSGGRLIDEGRNEQVNFRIANVRIDHGFLETYGIELAVGRDFSRDFPTDSTEAFLLNETAVKRLGWASPRDAIDRPFQYGGTNGRIIGVVKDFHYESLHEAITPIILVLRPANFNQLSVKIRAQRPGDLQEALGFLEARWREYRPDMPFNYRFLDESYAALYQNEEKLGEIFFVFSLLACAIACLGLFGLASFMAEQRTKEIGVRKVLGASVTKVALLMTKEFVILLVFASLLAWAVAFFAMNQWLLSFAYRLSIFSQAPTFVLASLLALVIAVATVSYQAIRAALTNPVEALRYE